MNQTPRKIKAGTPQMDGSDGFMSGALGYSLGFFLAGGSGFGGFGLVVSACKANGCRVLGLGSVFIGQGLAGLWVKALRF